MASPFFDFMPLSRPSSHQLWAGWSSQHLTPNTAPSAHTKDTWEQTGRPNNRGCLHLQALSPREVTTTGSGDRGDGHTLGDHYSATTVSKLTHVLCLLSPSLPLPPPTALYFLFSLDQFCQGVSCFQSVPNLFRVLSLCIIVFQFINFHLSFLFSPFYLLLSGSIILFLIC